MLKINHLFLCENCFSQLTEAEEICRVCGYSEETSMRYPTVLPAGTILIGRYIIGKVLGKGGFGVTYLSYDTREEKKVAIKEYYPDYLVHRNTGETIISSYEGEKETIFKSGMEKFFDEAKTLARFNGHPNIVNVFEFFYENNTAYFAMEYIEGIDLKGYVAQKGGVLNLDELVELIRPVMDALIIVHSLDILHRDISPDNIYITNDREIKLLDFGAARQVLGEQSKSLSVVLKPGFAPIEQYQTKGKQGPWTDVYALASTIYYCLTGIIPEAAMDRIEEDLIKPPSALNGNIPERLEYSLLKALSVRAGNRYQSVAEFKRDFFLEEIHSNVAIAQIPHNTEIVNTQKKAVSKKVLAVVAGIVLIFAAAIIAIIAVTGNNDKNVMTSGNASYISSEAFNSKAASSDVTASANTPQESISSESTQAVNSNNPSEESTNEATPSKVSGDEVNSAAATSTQSASETAAVSSSPSEITVEEDVSLKELSIAGYSLSPIFKPDNQEYNLTVPATVTNIKVNAVGSSNNTSVQISGEGVDPQTTLSATRVNVITVNVKAPSGKKKVYKINVVRKNEYNKDPALTNGGEVAVIPKNMHYEDGKLLVIARVFNNTTSDVEINSISFLVYDRHLDKAKNPQHIYAQDSFTYDNGLLVSSSDKYKDITLVFSGSGLINPNGDLTCLWWGSNCNYSKITE